VERGILPSSGLISFISHDGPLSVCINAEMRRLPLKGFDVRLIDDIAVSPIKESRVVNLPGD